VEKLLEDAQIKLSVVVSDIFGVSGRQMLAALIAGQRDPKALAQLARGTMRRKITTLQEAFTGYFTGHHAFLLAKMLARVDAIDTDLAALDATIGQMAAPFTAAVRRLAEIPGPGLFRRLHRQDRCPRLTVAFFHAFQQLEPQIRPRASGQLVKLSLGGRRDVFQSFVYSVGDHRAERGPDAPLRGTARKPPQAGFSLGIAGHSHVRHAASSHVTR
jgi:cell division protein FtsB